MTYSVIIPAFNASATIGACLTSVARQQLMPAEVIVVDDCSTDATMSVVAAFEVIFRAAGTSLIALGMKTNGGPSVARNAGIEQATGTHIAFLDADDVWLPNKLLLLDEVFKSHEADLVFHAYSDRLPTRQDVPVTRTITQLTSWDLLLRNVAQTSCVVMRRAAEFRFDGRMKYCEDYDLWMRVAETGTVLMMDGAPLTQLSRPQLSGGGLSAHTIRMRLGEIRVYGRFCLRRPLKRLALLPLLLLLSTVKHLYSGARRAIPLG